MPRLALLALLPLLACTSDPARDLSACDAAACRQLHLLTAFDVDAEATVSVLAGLEPVEQETLVRALAEQRPDALEASCGAVADGSPAWAICSRLRERPHLVRGRRGTHSEERPPRTAAGPDSRHPPIPTPVTTPPKDSAQACQQQFPGVPAAQAECLFTHAEALARAEGWRGADRMVALCAEAGDFVHGCLHHSIATMLPPMPAADRAAPEDLAESLQAVDALAGAVGDDQADAYRSFFWAMWTLHSFRAAQRIDGRLLQVLPADAHAHVRMAAAFRLLQRKDGPVGLEDLDAWTELLQAGLDDPGQAQPGSRHEATLWKARDFWPDDLLQAGEQNVPAVFCLGPGRRPLSDDPVEDLQLTLLEASARLNQPPPASFYAGIVASERSMLLRWTAVRLLGALYPEEVAALDLRGEPPLLRLRAANPLREK